MTDYVKALLRHYTSAVNRSGVSRTTLKKRVRLPGTDIASSEQTWYVKCVLLERENLKSDSHTHTGRALLCSITVFFWFAQYVYIPFLTPYLFTLSMTATMVGLIVGAYGVTQLVLRSPSASPPIS